MILTRRPRRPEPASITADGRSRRALALAVAVALSAPAAAVAGPPGLRADPAARIFPALATARAHTAATSAQTLVVTNCADNGAGSLRATLALAATGDTLDLGLLTCGAINLTSGALVVKADDIHLDGPGADRLAIDGGGTDRVLIDPYSSLTISGLTIRNGANVTSGLNIAGGGCIAEAGALTLVDSVVSGCLSSGEGAYGGALYAGALVMRNSTIRDSTAYGHLPGTGTAANGGAAFVYRVDIVDSTISGNTATHFADPPRDHYDVGGAMMIVRGGSISGSTFDHNRAGEFGGAIHCLSDLSIANSTFADNVVSRGLGGAIHMRRPSVLTANNVTIADNRAANGGGLFLTLGGATLTSSLVFGNTATAVSGTDQLSSPTPITLAGDHNLIGAGRGLVTVPADTLSADPQLGGLAANGGQTRTLALAIGSVAIDAGSNPLGFATDQRGTGHPRMFGSAADIGAFERSATPPLAVPALDRRLAALLAAMLGLVGLASRRRRAAASRAHR